MESQASIRGNLILRSSREGGWARFDATDTVFGDALSLGRNNAVAGWYNPYCRLLPGLLAACTETLHQIEMFGMDPGNSVAANAAQPIRTAVRHILGDLGWHDKTLDAYREAERSDYMEIMASAEVMLRQPNLDFVFLHLPLPHPPGFYDRRTGKMPAENGTYLDNLVLSDKTLAEIRTTLEQEGEWDSSTIVVMGDHSWRTGIWSKQPDWKVEEQIASGGVFDPRLAYLVKLPNEQTGLQVDAPFPALDTRKLLDGLMRGQLTTPQQVAAWATAQSQ